MERMAAREERGVEFYEGNLLVKTLTEEEELLQAYRLRHRVFAEGLKWVPERPDGVEEDIYDAWSTLIGVLSEESRLLGLVRMTHAPVPFMIENEFSACLAGGHRLRKAPDTAEITRLAVDPAITDHGLSARLMKTMFKGMYQWCIAHGVRYTYMVVEHRLLRVVQRMGWPCRPIGQPVALPPGEILSIGAVLDLNEFRLLASIRRPSMLEWVTKTLPKPQVPVRAIPQGREHVMDPHGQEEFEEDPSLVGMR